MVRHPVALTREVPEIGEPIGITFVVRGDPGGYHRADAPARDRGAAVTIHGPLNIYAGQAAGWTAAAKRLYRDLVQLGRVASADDGLHYMTNAMLGVLALDLGLGAARRFLANTPDALTDFPDDPAALDEAWGRIHAVRSEAIAHLDTWIATGEGSVRLDSDLTLTAGGVVVTSDDWVRWINAIEPWARRWADRDARTALDMPTTPKRIDMPAVRRRPGQISGE